MSALRAIRQTWEMANPWRPMIRDDRGRKIPLYRLELRWRRLGDRADLPPPEFARLREKLLTVTRAGMGHRPWVAAILAIVYTVFLWWISRLVPRPRVVFWTWTIGIVSFIWSALTYRYRIPKAGRELIALALLDERRCPPCAYELRGIAPDPDGCTACPECGAAWRIPPSGATAT